MIADLIDWLERYAEEHPLAMVGFLGIAIFFVLVINSANMKLQERVSELESKQEVLNSQYENETYEYSHEQVALENEISKLENELSNAYSELEEAKKQALSIENMNEDDLREWAHDNGYIDRNNFYDHTYGAEDLEKDIPLDTLMNWAYERFRYWQDDYPIENYQ